LPTSKAFLKWAAEYGFKWDSETMSRRLDFRCKVVDHFHILDLNRELESCFFSFKANFFQPFQYFKLSPAAETALLEEIGQRSSFNLFNNSK